MIFKTGTQEFQLYFKQPSIREIKAMAKYEHLAEKDEGDIDTVLDFIDFFSELYVPSEAATTEEFKEFLTDLPSAVFYSFCEQITDQVLRKHQKKVNDGQKS